MTATNRDLAEFALLGLNCQVLNLGAISSWADQIILAESEPPRWAVDLSVADLNETIHLLKEIPGVTSDDLSVKLLLALVHRRWKNGRLSLAQVVAIGSRLSAQDLLPQRENKADWGVILACQYEEFKQGYLSEGEIRASVEDKLASYAEFEKYLPGWVT
jgi:hypothetical protein